MLAAASSQQDPSTPPHVAIIAQGLIESAMDRLHALPFWAQSVVVGVLTLVVSYIVVKVAAGILKGIMTRSRFIDETLKAFLGSVITAAGWVLIITATLVGFGVPPTAVAGVLAAGTFIIGFALKDTLGNLAAGVVILLNKPYRVGEAVQLKGHDGTVLRLGVSMTELKTWDGRHVSVPNGTILSDAILNWSRNPTRRIDVRVGVAYDDDAKAAVDAIQKALEAHPLVLKDPAPFVMVEGLGDSSVNIVARPWVELNDFLLAVSEAQQTVKRAVEAAGCTIPFPQRDIHVYDSTPGTNGGGPSGGDGGHRDAMEKAAGTPT